MKWASMYSYNKATTLLFYERQVTHLIDKICQNTLHFIIINVCFLKQQKTNHSALDCRTPPFVQYIWDVRGAQSLPPSSEMPQWKHWLAVDVSSTTKIWNSNTILQYTYKIIALSQKTPDTRCSVISFTNMNRFPLLSHEDSIRNVLCYVWLALYRAMHFSAKRGIVIACRLSVRPSVRPSVCNVGELWSHRLKFFENNFIIS